MGLRTVTLSSARTAAPSRDEWRRRVDLALSRAAAAITAGRTDEVRELAAEIASWDEPHRVYQARRQLTELVFSASANLSEHAWTDLYQVTADVLLDALEQAPAEPVLLNYTGVLLYELAEADAAATLFRAAHRLDPELEHVEDNLRQARRRARAGRGAPRPASSRARELGVRARRIVAAARPAEGLTLSLVMIVKDEEEMLPGCLAAVRDAVDEMIVVDTGSSDRTVEIAESYGAKVVRSPWNGSFSDARNVSLDHATGDWVLYLDADEHLVPEDASLLRGLLGRTWREAFYLVETNYTGVKESGSSVAHLALRLFRRRPEYRFEGRIHEQKTQTMPTYLPERFETTPIRMLHYGYLKNRIGDREKSKRNLELLQQEAHETPGPFVDFNLGSEYIALGRFDLACTHLDRGWAALRREPGWHGKGYAPMLAARVAQARREAGKPGPAREAIDEALAFYPDHTELVLQAAMCARDEGDLDEAARLAERCLEQGDAPARYGAAVGVGTYLASSLLAEIRTSQGRPDAAEELYRRALEEHPDYVAPVLPLASLEIARGAEPDDVCIRLASERPSAALLLASALYEGGRSTEAEELFRDVLAAQPGNGVARIGLVETLLARRAYAEAAAEARLEPAESPVAAAAAGAELFACAASGDAPQLAAALESAAEHGVPSHDLALYRGWLALLAGKPAPASLPAAAAPTTFTALEALLRVVDVDAFSVLHRLAEQLAIDPRERREALAGMYLRRGFLDSAAEEWVAVAQQAPDARAYLGLAQVALARGLGEDAQTLAAAAAAADPGNVPAAKLTEALAAREKLVAE